MTRASCHFYTYILYWTYHQHYFLGFFSWMGFILPIFVFTVSIFERLFLLRPRVNTQICFSHILLFFIARGCWISYTYVRSFFVQSRPILNFFSLIPRNSLQGWSALSIHTWSRNEYYHNPLFHSWRLYALATIRAQPLSNLMF